MSGILVFRALSSWPFVHGITQIVCPIFVEYKINFTAHGNHIQRTPKGLKISSLASTTFCSSSSSCIFFLGFVCSIVHSCIHSSTSFAIAPSTQSTLKKDREIFSLAPHQLSYYRYYNHKWLDLTS